MNEKVIEFLRKPAVVPTTVGVISALAGGAIGYYVGMRRWREIAVTAVDMMEDQADEAIQMRLDLDAEADLYNELGASVRAAREARAEERDRLTSVVQPYISAVNPPEVVNVFEIHPATEPDWDWAVELPKREGANVYIINRHEFFHNEEGHEQTSLTYYVGDDVLTDEHDKPIPQYEHITGPLLFGHGSDDASIVYIRNVSKDLEMEVVRHPGRYEVEVLGVDYEDEKEQEDIKHSHSPRRFRVE